MYTNLLCTFLAANKKDDLSATELSVAALMGHVKAISKYAVGLPTVFTS